MAKHLDLEEQEQLDQLKHFWAQYGNLITWALISVFGAVAAWNGWQYWERSRAAQASVLFDQVEQSTRSGDVSSVERSFADLKDKFPKTTFAQQAGLLAAKTFHEKGNLQSSTAALSWVAESAADPGYQAVAKLRLAGLLIDAKNFDGALKMLAGPFPTEFEALAADRRGDVHLIQNQTVQAQEEFLKAFKGVDERSDYRRLIEVKLNALGVDPNAKSPIVPGGKP